MVPGSDRSVAFSPKQAGVHARLQHLSYTSSSTALAPIGGGLSSLSRALGAAGKPECLRSCGCHSQAQLDALEVMAPDSSSFGSCRLRRCWKSTWNAAPSKDGIRFR
eukprot:s3511_g5.t1